MRLNASISLFLLVLLVCAARSPAQPATQPAPEAPRRNFPARAEPLTSEALSAMDAWMPEHMPNLHELIQRTSESRAARLRNYAAFRMRAMENVADEPELHQKLMKDIENEDRVFALVMELERAPVAERAAVRRRLRDAVRQTVENVLAERARRIERLKARLAQEESRLAEDQKNLDQLIERRMRTFVPRLLQESEETEP